MNVKACIVPDAMPFFCLKAFLASDFVAGYRNIGRITNDSATVITGKYSALGISSPNERLLQARIVIII